LTVTNDGASTLDRASCEVDRNALAELRNEQRFVGLMQAANRGTSLLSCRAWRLFEHVRPLTAQRRSLEMMADITDGHATLSRSISRRIFAASLTTSARTCSGYYSNASRRPLSSITVRVKRPACRCARVRAIWPSGGRSGIARVIHRAVARHRRAQRGCSRAEPAGGLGRGRPAAPAGAVVWTPASTAVIRAVAEVPRGNARGDDWSKGGQVDVTLRSASGAVVATERIALQPGTFAAELALTPAASLEPGEYDLQVRAKGVQVLSPAAETIPLSIYAAPLGTGELFLRRGPGTGNREVLTADARFRRAERLILESPASLGGEVTARLLDRTGKPLNVPVTVTIREAADLSRWRRVEIALAPLAAGDYIIESTAGSERTMTGFRVVP
jgi:hypothetical protein